MAFEITIPMDPVPKARPRLGAKGKVFTPKDTQVAEARIGIHLRGAKAPRLKGPVRLEIVFVVTPPNHLTKGRSKQWASVRPDLDNYVKTVMDAGNDILWDDDAQVCELICRKIYGPQPAIAIRATTLVEADNAATKVVASA